MDIRRIEGPALNEAICRALGLEIDVYAGKITAIFRMPGNIVRTFDVPDWSSDVNAARELLESFIGEHRQSAGPGLWYGNYFQVVLGQGLDWSVMLCKMDKQQHNVSRYGDVRSLNSSLASAMCKAWLKSIRFVDNLQTSLYQIYDGIFQHTDHPLQGRFENSIYMVGDEEEIARKFNGRTYLVTSRSGIHIVARSAIV